MKHFSVAGLLETLQAIKRDRHFFKIVKQALCFKIICKCGSGFKLKVDSSPEFKMFGVRFFCVIFFFGSDSRQGPEKREPGVLRRGWLCEACPGAVGMGG